MTIYDKYKPIIDECIRIIEIEKNQKEDQEHLIENIKNDILPFIDDVRFQEQLKKHIETYFRISETLKKAQHHREIRIKIFKEGIISFIESPTISMDINIEEADLNLLIKIFKHLS